MPRLTEEAHQIVRDVARRGEIVIDATAGNGHDTCFLARLVGPDGVVIAVDIQPQALQKTARRLLANHLSHVRLEQQDHADLSAAVPARYHGRIAAVMFNLGYLPGGEKSLTTQPESTLAALQAALTLLRPGGVVTVLAYAGHPGGDKETTAVSQFLAGLSPKTFDVDRVDPNASETTGPRLFAVRKVGRE